MNILRNIATLLLVLCLCVAVYGAEGTTATTGMVSEVSSTPAVTSTVDAAPSILTIILSIVAAAVTALFSYIGSRIVTHLKSLSFYAKATADEQAVYDLILQGVFNNEKLVTAIKEAAADGKLTKDEIERLKILAIEYAQSIATPELKTKLIAMGRKKLEIFIEQALASIKK